MKICEYLFTSLDECTDLYVHSSFEKAINLWDNKKIIACLALSPLPMSITRNIMPICHVGDRITIKKSEFSKGDITDYKYICSDISSEDQLIPRCKKLIRILESRPSVFTDIFYSHPESKADFIRDDLIKFISNPCDNTAGKIVGYGEGLTPSCDDFLRGWCMMSLGLGTPFYVRYTGTTTKVSEFLQSSINLGLMDPTGSMCVHQLLDIGKTQVEVSAKNMINLGHTSGADCLWGMAIRLITHLKIDILNI